MNKILKKHFDKLVLALVLISLVFIYYCVPNVSTNVNKVFAMLVKGDFENIKIFVRSYGAYAILVSFALMIMQCIVAPLPAFVITLANAGLFGWWQGALLSWVSSLAGASTCFYITRILGRDAAQRFVSKGSLLQVDKFFEKYGKNAVLICRLFPVISFDYVSYAAGLTPMSYSEFALATGIGQIPAIFIYSYFGKILTQRIEYLVIGLLVFFTLGAVVFIMKNIYRSKSK